MGIHRKIRTRRAKIKKVNFLASPREGVRRGNFSRVTLLHIISTLITDTGSTSHLPAVCSLKLGARGKPSTMFTARDDS